MCSPSSRCAAPSINLSPDTLADPLACSSLQLLHNFPRDHKDSTGNLFWSGTKRAPTALEFDPNDDMHMEFVSGAAHIVAYNFGVKVPKGKKR